MREIGRVLVVDGRASWHRRSTAAVCGSAAVAMLLTACGSGRSVDAYCETFVAEKEAYLAKYSGIADEVSTAEDPALGLLMGLGAGFQSIGDARMIFDRLEPVAPEEIQPDIVVIRDSMDAQMEAAGDSLSDPLGAIGSGLVTALTTRGSYERVADYTQTHCGVS